MATYSDKLKNPKWQKKRLEIFERDKWACKYCGDKETTLNVHHLSYSGEPWEAPNDQLITTCEHCHCMLEFYKKNLDENRVVKKVLKGHWNSGSSTIIMVIKENEGNTFGSVVDGEFFLHISISYKSFNSMVEFLTSNK